MRIGTRITLTTAAVVAIILGVYGWVTLRSRHAEGTEDIKEQARELATTLRSAIESSGFDRFLEANLYAEMPWRIELLDVGEVPPKPSDIPEIERLRWLVNIEGPVAEEVTVDGKRAYAYMLPIRDGKTGLLVGAIEVSRPLEAIDNKMAAARVSIISSVIVLLAAIVLIISLLARQGITLPIAKLVAGIDDVAKGDLTHVVLQERDDEVGALAARFNEMTTSLREAREETLKGAVAKLALETRLRQSEKMATIGQIAAEIAHEVGTPLNVVTGRARTMAKKAGDPKSVEKNATIIAEQAGRITRIIQRLLDFARRQVGGPGKGPVNLNDLTRNIVEFLEHQLSQAHVTCTLNLENNLDEMSGNQDELQQVLLNLTMNAIQAMSDGGKLLVSTAKVYRQRPGLAMAPKQHYVELAISDSGTGISDEERDKIFVPFYTSKTDSGGTGLGLVVALGIVKDHDGWMEIENRASQDDPSVTGSVFRVYLPINEASEGTATTGETSSENNKKQTA